jgi:hypothetical protein
MATTVQNSSPNSEYAVGAVHLFHLSPKERVREQVGSPSIRPGVGIHFFDEDDRPHIEGLAGQWSVAVGFGENRLVKAAARQLQALGRPRKIIMRQRTSWSDRCFRRRPMRQPSRNLICRFCAFGTRIGLTTIGSDQRASRKKNSPTGWPRPSVEVILQVAPDTVVAFFGEPLGAMASFRLQKPIGLEFREFAANGNDPDLVSYQGS